MALTGPWRAAPLLVLTPALALFDGSTPQISACDALYRAGLLRHEAPL